jgi:aryl-alcohol dehydrogenase-like predicted oxidoreductase
MDSTVLGATGLKVSVMGLGCGGPSRLGLATGSTEESAIAVVRRALALGIDFIDSAEGYGTETAVGKAIRGVPRDQVVLSTKVGPRNKEGLSNAADIRARVEECLRRLRTDYVDILHLHAVRLADYAYVHAELVPALLDLRSQGKIRFLGVTEQFAADPQHAMLRRALEDDCWEVIMVGFNLLNQSARDTLFPKTRAMGIGVLNMFAVRRALSDGEKLKAALQGLVEQGLLRTGDFDPEAPLDFLLQEGGAFSLPDAAYRFCRDEPGIHVVLSGTGSREHLEANAASLSRPPLAEAAVARVQRLFQGIDSVSGN